jgi:hypothetical protein
MAFRSRTLIFTGDGGCGVRVCMYACTVRLGQDHDAAVAAPGFTLAGATGVNAANVNFTFAKLDEQQNGKSVCGVVGNPTYCCWYTRRGW